MKTHKSLIVIGIMALVALITLALFTGLTQAQGSEPQGTLSVAAVVGSKISYQGMLKENGSPVNGTRTITFTLSSDSGCSTVKQTIVKSVPITNGLFTADLNVTQSHFDSQALWLGSKVGATQIGCQEILPVPYAFSLRPKAVISSTGDLTDALFKVQIGNANVKGSMVQGLLLGAAGVYGYAENLPIAVGVMGVSDGNDYDNWGVWGESSSNSDHGRGVYGKGFYGVYGETISNTNGAAGYFVGDVKQRRTDDGLVKAGVHANCSAISAALNRSFNNVGGTISIANGTSTGECTINFGFNIYDRYFVAMAVNSNPRGVSCYTDSNYQTKLYCLVWDAAGTGQNGLITVLIY